MLTRRKVIIDRCFAFLFFFCFNFVRTKYVEINLFLIYIAADIQRSLVRRARLRRKYFQMLEREGEKVPEKPKGSLANEKVNSEQSDDNGDDDESDDEDEVPDKEEDVATSNEDDFFERSKAEKKRTKKPIESTSLKKDTTKVSKPLTHVDRMQLIKDRKKQKREEMEESYRKRKLEREQKEKARRKSKDQMNQFTRKGQPKMGPRISRLLDQIKEETSKN